MYWFRAGLPTLQGGRLDILWCVPRPALKHHSQSIHFFLFFSEKKIKKIKSCEKLCTGSGQAYPPSRGGGLTSSGVSPDQH